MPYWVCHKRGKYIADLDEAGNPILTGDESKAFHFKSFDSAMLYFQYGFTISKRYT